MSEGLGACPLHLSRGFVCLMHATSGEGSGEPRVKLQGGAKGEGQRYDSKAPLPICLDKAACTVSRWSLSTGSMHSREFDQASRV